MVYRIFLKNLAYVSTRVLAVARAVLSFSSIASQTYSAERSQPIGQVENHMEADNLMKCSTHIVARSCLCMTGKHIQCFPEGVNVFFVVGQEDSMGDHSRGDLAILFLVVIEVQRVGRGDGRGLDRGERGGWGANGPRLCIDTESGDVLRYQVLYLASDLPQRPAEANREEGCQKVNEDVVDDEYSLQPRELIQGVAVCVRWGRFVVTVWA